MALPVPGEGAGEIGVGDEEVVLDEVGLGGIVLEEVGLDVVADKIGDTNCERPGTSPTKRCKPRPLIAPVPPDTPEAIPGLANGIVVVGLAVESAAALRRRDVPVTVLVVTEEGAGCANAAPVDRRLSVRVGEDGDGEGGGGLCVDPADGSVTITCPGRLVNFRWSERAVDVDGEGEVGGTVLGSMSVESVSSR